MVSQAYKLLLLVKSAFLTSNNNQWVCGGSSSCSHCNLILCNQAFLIMMQQKHKRLFQKYIEAADVYRTNVAESEDRPLHRNGMVKPVPASPSQGTLSDVTPSSYRSDTRLKTVEGHQYLAALSERTITDSTPGSTVVHHTPSLDEGTILSSVSSYRSVIERPPGTMHILFTTFLWF